VIHAFRHSTDKLRPEDGTVAEVSLRIVVSPAGPCSAPGTGRK
jgi:hypothetical protein